MDRAEDANEAVTSTVILGDAARDVWLLSKSRRPTHLALGVSLSCAVPDGQGLVLMVAINRCDTLSSDRKHRPDVARIAG